MSATEIFRRARDLLIATQSDYERARREFDWPRFETFNWAHDWFDVIARGNTRTALRIVDDSREVLELSFEQLRVNSNRLASYLLRIGVRRGDSVLLMVGNAPALWETMLALIKLGCPAVPTTTLMTPADLRYRLEHANVKAVVTEPQYADRFAGLMQGRIGLLTQGTMPGWLSLSEATSEPADFAARGTTRANDPLLLYFTSGTTSRPKLVVHTHVSYPVGHLSTMYWAGIRPGDVHLNLSSPGWAKHAYSSFFAPWAAEATVVAMHSARFDPARLLDVLITQQVTSFCAPPTVWRALVGLPLASYGTRLRELLSAGEPLNPEVIAQVRQAWGLTVRDGYGQTETTLQVGNFPGQPVVPGCMGRPAPGYRITLLDSNGEPATEGEICVDLGNAPAGVMSGYLDDPQRTAAVMRNGHYHTGDSARVEDDGNITFVGRNDDVFKSSDYRISPFELESVLIEHEAVIEAAVIPSPDPRRLSVPKACVILAPGFAQDRATAQAILHFVRERVPPYQRIRRIEFRDLPKTVSGKIRRVELRQAELARTSEARGACEFWEEDFK
jgi:acetyl-CoA synthetase